MATCRLCHRLFDRHPKAHRALYCPSCQAGKQRVWRQESRERRRKRTKVGGCAVCHEEIGGQRARSSFLVPGQLFCPRCSMVLNSRLTLAEFETLLALRFLHGKPSLEVRISTFPVDSPSSAA